MYKPDNGLPDYGIGSPYKTTQYGWQCPKCSNIYAPFVTECAKCNNSKANSFTVTASNQHTDNSR